MREIKFRAWFKDKLEMREVATNNVYQLNNNSWWYLSPMPMSDYEPIELMQYTGLHDVNGKEIYEGDIIDCGQITRRITWLDGGFVAIHKKDDHVDCMQSNMKDVVVLGNIYENKELIQ